MKTGAIMFLIFFGGATIYTVIRYIKEVRLSKWRVVVEMTSEQGNRYRRTIEVETFSDQGARALAMVQAREHNHEYKFSTLWADRI